MPTPLRRRLRLLRRGFGYTVAVALVLVALLLGVASRLLPLADRNPDAVAAWLSERVGRPIAFDRVETSWTRRGPLLQLDNLRIGKGERAFTVGDTEMLVSIYAGLLPGVPLSELRLRGLELALERDADGRWQVRGLPGQQEAGAGDPFEALEGLGELQVIDGQLSMVAPDLGIDMQVPKIDLRLRVDAGRVRAGLRAWPQAGLTAPPPRIRIPGVAAVLRHGAPIDAALELDRTTGTGRLYAGAAQIDLSAWAPLLRLHGVGVQAGEGRAQAWLGLEQNRIARVTVDTDLARVELRGQADGDAAAAPDLRFDRLTARARWQRLAGGWRLDAPTLQIDAGEDQYRMDGLLVATGEQQAIRATRIDVAPLLAIVALSDRLSPGMRRWLSLSRPRGTLHGIALDGRRGGPLHASARLEGLGFGPVDDRPGLHGVAGELFGDADGFNVALDASRPVRFDWPVAFGKAHEFTLDGNVGGWREGGGWQIGTSALRIRGETVGFHARGGLTWQGDGSRPRIDIATTIDPMRLPDAREFWLRHLMSEALVEWLDTALVAGELRNGRALVSGDLDDWPFEGDDGRFEATGHIADATVRFQPDWPAADHMELDASFIGNGFAITGRGALAGIAMPSVKAELDHYRHATLTVQAGGKGDVGQLFDLLKASPLRASSPETFDSLKGRGAADVDFRLRLPMFEGGVFAIDGGVALAGASLADPRFDLAVDQVRGRAEYSRTGFHAEGLQVRFEGLPGRLSLRAGDGHVRDRGNVLEGGLEAAFDADALLARAPELAWLQPHLEGRSQWTVGVDIPKAVQAGADTSARLHLRSDLVGTALTLPAPLAKPVDQALATSIETLLPMGRGEVRVGLGDRLALRARTDNGRTGVRAVLGSDRVLQAPPVSGLVVGGRADTLDALDWIGIARGGGQGGAGGPGEAGGLALGRIDVTAGQLQLLGGVFPDTRLLVMPGSAGSTAVRVEGAALQGQVRVPAGDGLAVAGQFERVHWRPAATAAAAPDAAGAPEAAATAGGARPDDSGAARASASGAAAVAGDDANLDPGAIPPLSLDVADLRIAGASFGHASLRTRPTATGLVIEQLQARLPGQVIEVGGSWNGRGANARTDLEIEVDSRNLGGLLAGSAAAGRLAGGKGTARLAARWPGGPAQFDLAVAEGSLVLDAQDGRLLEVEPGAGRVLGLLSVADLPRRLALDFRDFFSKGFAFNQAGGTIRFADGVARADDLHIEGPAAEIRIRGAANLRSETYDQTIEVLPRTGNLLTVAGAIAAGPVGAAIGAAANAVLHKPLGQLAAKTYHVTGPWKDPKVEVISRELPRPAPATPASGAPAAGTPAPAAPEAAAPALSPASPSVSSPTAPPTPIEPAPSA